MIWQQLILYSNHQDASYLSDVLMEIGALAVTLEDTKDTPIYEPDPHHITLWQQTTVTALFEENDNLRLIIDELKNKLANLPLPPYQIQILQDKNWVEQSKEQFKPLFFGNNLWICPSWCEIPDPAATNIMLDPGLAFGTGTHPTTALCLRWLSSHPPISQRVIDYGCGSGILGIAAAKLGAHSIWAIDNHEQALQATRQNAINNNISMNDFHIVAPENLPALQAEVIIANILLQPLLNLASDFDQLLNKNGSLVVSGILIEQQQILSEAYQRWFNRVEIIQHDQWVCISFTKKDKN